MKRISAPLIALALLFAAGNASAARWNNQRCASLLNRALGGESVAQDIHGWADKLALLGAHWGRATEGLDALREALTIRDRSWRNFFFEEVLVPDEHALNLAARILEVHGVTMLEAAPKEVKYPTAFCTRLNHQAMHSEMTAEQRQAAWAYVIAEGVLAIKGKNAGLPNFARPAALRLMDINGLRKNTRFNDRAVLLMMAHGEGAETVKDLLRRLEDFGITNKGEWVNLLMEISLRRSVRGESEGYRGGNGVRGRDLFLEGLLEETFSWGHSLENLLNHAGTNFDSDRAVKLANYVLTNALSLMGGPEELARELKDAHTQPGTYRFGKGENDVIETAPVYTAPEGLLRTLWPLHHRLQLSAAVASEAIIGFLFTQQQIVRLMGLRDHRGKSLVYGFSEEFVGRYPAEQARFMAGAPYPFVKAAAKVEEAAPAVEAEAPVVEEPKFEFHGETVTVAQIESQPTLRTRVINECFPFLPEPERLDDSLRSLSPTMGDDILHQVAAHISYALSTPVRSGQMPPRELWPLCGAMVDRYEESLKERMPGFDDFTAQFSGLRRAFSR